MARRRRTPPPTTTPEPTGRVYVLWRHHYDDFEIIGVFTSPEKFQAYVAKRFPKTQVGSRWLRGNGEWRMATTTWDYVASPLVIDDEGEVPK